MNGARDDVFSNQKQELKEPAGILKIKGVEGHTNKMCLQIGLM